MGRLKTAANRMEHKKVVHRHMDSGRTYNHIEGSGWCHYTKGFRKRSITMDRINKAYDYLFSFLEKAIDKKFEEKQISEKLSNVIDSFKGDN